MILDYLTCATGPDDIHGIGMALRSIPGNVVSTLPGMPEVLVALYEHGPCSFCRKHVVERLAELNAIPDWMKAEGRHDCVPEVAARFVGP